jgi:hypothetical protein
VPFVFVVMISKAHDVLGLNRAAAGGCAPWYLRIDEGQGEAAKDQGNDYSEEDS